MLTDSAGGTILICAFCLTSGVEMRAVTVALGIATCKGHTGHTEGELRRALLDARREGGRW